MELTIQRALGLLRAAGSRIVTMEILEADLEVAGLIEDGTFSLIDLAAYWIKALDDGSSPS